MTKSFEFIRVTNGAIDTRRVKEMDNHEAAYKAALKMVSDKQSVVVSEGERPIWRFYMQEGRVKCSVLSGERVCEKGSLFLKGSFHKSKWNKVE